MALVNSWGYAKKNSASQDVIVVRWVRSDSADPKVMTPESGQFDYTLVDGDTWTVSKAAIEVKVTAKDGQEM